MEVDRLTHIFIDNDSIMYSKGDVRYSQDLKINYTIDKDEKVIRLYNVPRFLTFQEKEYIYYILLDTFFFYPRKTVVKYDGFENYTVKENGYSFYEYNSKDNPQGILGELLFDVPRPEKEPDRIARIRDIYDMLIRNYKEIGVQTICLAINGSNDDFKTVYLTIKYIFDNHPKLKKKLNEVYVLKKSGLFGTNKRIIILPKKSVEKAKENDRQKDE